MLQYVRVLKQNVPQDLALNVRSPLALQSLALRGLLLVLNKIASFYFLPPCGHAY